VPGLDSYHRPSLKATPRSGLALEGIDFLDPLPNSGTTNKHLQRVIDPIYGSTVSRGLARHKLFENCNPNRQKLQRP
jgi:hypothetical protein